MSDAPRQFVLTPGPHLHVDESTARIMWWVNGSLAPVVLWGAYVFGLNALAVVLASIAGAAGAEWASSTLLKRRPTLADGSAVCTGLLLALTLPPRLPAWEAFLGAVFAIALGKMIFGGLGFNLFNPALLGRAFLMATFPLGMTSGWAVPRPWFGAHLDAVTTATPLAVLKEQGLAAALHVVASPAGVWNALALGFRPGSIGEVSLLLIALGAGALLARRIITLTIPLSVMAGVALSTLHTGVPMLHLMSGGLWLGAFYMATDYVTSPTSRNGRIVFGLVVGLLTGVIRVYGGYPEGICYAILIANALAPALDMWFRPRRVATGEPIVSDQLVHIDGAPRAPMNPREVARIAVNLAVVCALSAVVLGGVYMGTARYQAAARLAGERAAVTRMLALEGDTRVLEVRQFLSPAKREVVYRAKPYGEESAPVHELVFSLDGALRTSNAAAGAAEPAGLVPLGRLFVAQKSGAAVGFVIEGETRGYKNRIRFFVALDTSFTVQGVKVIEHEEDPGLGAEVATTWFQGQFVGRTADAIATIDVTRDPMPEDWRAALVTVGSGTVGEWRSRNAALVTREASHPIYAVTGATISSRALTRGIRTTVDHFRRRWALIAPRLGEPS